MKILLVALNAHYMHTNLAVRSLQSALKSAGWDAEIFENHINTPYRRLLEEIGRQAPDIIGFSCYIFNIALIKRIAAALKRALPEVRIVFGGPEVSDGDDALIADYVITGEGEDAIVDLVKAISEDAPFLQPPNYSAEWPDAYAGGIEEIKDRILYLETSRGCPYRCGYCLSSAQPGVRALDVDTALERLTALADQGAKLIKLVDRTFNFDVKRANRIFSGLIDHANETGHSPVYHFEIGAHLVDEATLDVLARAPVGLFQFEVGIQSTDAQVLKNIDRTPPFEKIACAVRRIKALKNIAVHVDLIAGLPGESIETFARSFNEAAALGADVLQLGFLKLLKGSKLRREADALGIVYEPDAPYEVLSTPTLSFSDICFLKDVETLVDWYMNTGRYSAPLTYLLKRALPFSLFAHLAQDMRAQGVFAVERGERARAEALLRFAAPFDSEGILGDLLRHGFLRANRRRDLPDVLAFSETDAQRACLRERYHPVRGQSAIEVGFDIEQYLACGDIVRGAYTYIYEPGGGFFRA